MVILNLGLVVSYCCYGAEESSKAFTGSYGWLTLWVPSQGLSLLHLFLRQASSWSPGCYASGLSFPTSACQRGLGRGRPPSGRSAVSRSAEPPQILLCVDMAAVAAVGFADGSLLLQRLLAWR